MVYSEKKNILVFEFEDAGWTKLVATKVNEN